MALEIKQKAQHKGGEYWDWSVWVEASPTELEKIKSVTYRLHETFPEPVRVQKNRSQKFRLDSSGWGEFTIFVDIEPLEGKTITKRHYLALEEPRDTQQHANAEGAAVYLCYAASDKRIASLLERWLRESKLNVVNAGQIAGSAFRVALAESLKSIDALVAIVSEEPGEWVLFEIGLAQGAGVPVIPVMEGSGSPPSVLAKVQTVRIDLSADPELEEASREVIGGIHRALKRRASQKR